MQIEEHARALVGQWRGDFVGAMQAMGDFCPKMETDLAPPAGGRDMLWWHQPFDLAAGAAIWIGAPEQTWSVLGQRILEAAGVESSGPAELRDTYLEVLRQSLGVLARGVGGQLGREVATTAGSETAPPPDPAFSCQIAISTPDQELPSMAFHINRGMLAAVQKFTHGASAEPGQSDQPAPDEFSARACGTLDLLLDVEMPVSVSFGRTQVRIQDILKLTSGSIIELDRGIAEPVEVIVNNCIIARGEVVVVDGNYGVRINEVMSRKERLQESRKYLLPASTHRH
ncbi:MAG: flagellar motor switch protein FliN [Candidatus Solibacter sp.]